MTQISKDILNFVEEAKREFEAYPFLETYRNQNETLIALRTGEDRDCIAIYRLDGYVANFVQQMQPLPLKRFW
ncbi:hypothetical protein [Virgibacillus pantothenticus]|uniref:Uncharacterized protein n=1 Tax=Virgibacillus pantothenticus TaxID=1473 RepID=A0A0L0QM43_VIRPA|nr:hypothetical protein [Virgibacillus pantothenticus]KNE19690.1 hypothetical protein AFK71_14675 [Virgibacillus pantothenticus]MED3735874.1 hypothetical protein [Virgibacillus pantothenticus]QTY14777.1 hypothetical protein KBP50_12615 [Virgibacillus pantothenticus]SIT15178.1 hypothetical protein SAMN05421787_12316 [Virgibacillus pantothenticus]